MFKELLSILTGDSPLKETSEKFSKMLWLSREMVLEARRFASLWPPGC